MANEITYSASLNCSKNGASVTGAGGTSFDMSGTEMTSLVQTLSTSEGALSLGGVDQVGYLLIKNLSAVAVTIASDNASAHIIGVLPAGGSLLTAGCSTTLYGKCASGTADIFTVVAEA